MCSDLISLIIDPRGLKCETNSYEILGYESSDVRFDPWALLQGQSMVLVSCLVTNLHRFSNALV